MKVVRRHQSRLCTAIGFWKVGVERRKERQSHERLCQQMLPADGSIPCQARAWFCEVGRSEMFCVQSSSPVELGVQDALAVHEAALSVPSSAHARSTKDSDTVAANVCSQHCSSDEAPPVAASPSGARRACGEVAE